MIITIGMTGKVTISKSQQRKPQRGSGTSAWSWKLSRRRTVGKQRGGGSRVRERRNKGGEVRK